MKKRRPRKSRNSVKHEQSGKGSRHVTDLDKLRYLPTKNLHPSHWHSMMRLLRRYEQSEPFRERQDDRREAAQFLDVRFRSLDECRHQWEISSAETGDLILLYDDRTGKYTKPDGTHGRLRRRGVVRAMEIAAGRKLADAIKEWERQQDEQEKLRARIREENQNAQTLGIRICHHANGLIRDLRCKNTNYHLATIQETETGSWCVLKERMDFSDLGEVLLWAANKNRRIGAGTIVRVRNVTNECDERYVITTEDIQAERYNSTSSDGVTPLKWHCPLATELRGMRMGDSKIVEFGNARVEYVVLDVTDSGRNEF